MSLVNDDFYFSLKYERPLTVSEIREAYRSKFLNWNFFNLTTFRYGSLLKNIISYSYVMMISITYGLVLKIKKIQYFLIVFVIVLLISFSKGAIIFSILTVFIVVFNRNVLKKNRVSIVETIILLIPFWLLVITVGYFSNNEHIIGFVSGFHRMMDNPFGNGLGFSGNLSPVRKLSVFGEELPFRGYWTRFYNGSESIIGVLFSSLGFFGFIYLGVLFTLIAKSKENLLKSENFILLFPLIMVFQGIFQEEAFSPYALGFTMFILGLYNGKNIRLNY
ncbi:hypothetical protein [Flammeovirga kamogawensis]|uniref:O-antigen ligase family protein n=2 Tax=Flammeovirga kamogawensis TaxID=373891 RepID=A0ABX8GS94_9BACT|nr:hypothetical protein [Flammeovirga kamogawensis]QWG06421.1 hypothetical protein KM029_13910 [Flammeovirga kamogawensis]